MDNSGGFPIEAFQKAFQHKYDVEQQQQQNYSQGIADLGSSIGNIIGNVAENKKKALEKHLGEFDNWAKDQDIIDPTTGKTVPKEIYPEIRKKYAKGDFAIGTNADAEAELKTKNGDTVYKFVPKQQKVIFAPEPTDLTHPTTQSFPADATVHVVKQPTTTAAGRMVDVTPRTQQQADSLNTLEPGLNATPGQKTKVKENTLRSYQSIEVSNIKEKQKKAIEASILTPASIDLQAQKLAMGGKMDLQGMGGMVAKGAILNRYAQIELEKGNTAQASALKQQANKADQASLVSLTKLSDNINAFEKTAVDNINLVKKLSEKVDRLGVPAIDRWLQAGRKSIAGDVDVAKLDAAVRVAINEAAKVTSGASNGAVTTDAARKDIENILAQYDTKEQILGEVETLTTDMENRKKGLQSQLDEIKSRLTGGGVAPSQSQQQANPKVQEQINLDLKSGKSKDLIKQQLQKNNIDPTLYKGI